MIQNVKITLMELRGEHIGIFDPAQHPLPHMRGFEVSVQSLAQEAGQPHEAPSQALHDLSDAGHPDITPFPERSAQHVISNDELARYYTQTAVRAVTAEYLAAPNRVAFIIGEGAAVAALPYIPEETVILADISKDMVDYLAGYTRALQTEPDFDEWKNRISRSLSQYSEQRPAYVANSLQKQAHDWAHAGHTHPLNSHEHYVRAQYAARTKAIVPYHMDITDPASVQHLATTLRQHGATITFMNLTNVIGYNNLTGPQMADVLAALPTTPNIPILTTSSLQHSSSQSPSGEQLGHLGATGPFFGLDNLRRGGKAITRGDFAGPLAVRRLLVG